MRAASLTTVHTSMRLSRVHVVLLATKLRVILLLFLCEFLRECLVLDGIEERLWRCSWGRNMQRGRRVACNWQRRLSRRRRMDVRGDVTSWYLKRHTTWSSEAMCGERW